jgi:glycosyltransferase involved in cell wall biosynthesis
VSGLVSILIPAYNAEKWIGETIQSALSQTWLNKEIIIVNDGSTDNTLSIASRFESKTVKVISQDNVGGCAARNKALEYAQGEYIQWLDSDDLLAPNKIALQMSAADSGVSSRVLFSGPYGIFYASPKRANFIRNSLWQDLSPVEWMLRKFSENIFLIPACWLVSRNLTEVTGKWDERLWLNQDGEYFCRVVARSERVKFTSKAVCYYRQSGFQQKNQDRSGRASRSLLLSQQLCIQYLRSLEESERTRIACLKYLEDWFHFYYPENQELVARLREMAADLGGKLEPQGIGWKFYPMAKLIGLEKTKKLRANWGKNKLAIMSKLDKMLLRLAGK